MTAPSERRLEHDVLTALESLLALPFGELVESQAARQRLLASFRAQLPALGELETVEPEAAARHVARALQHALEQVMRENAASSEEERAASPAADLAAETSDPATPRVEEFGGAGDLLEMSTEMFELERELEGLFSHAKRRKGAEPGEELREDELPSLGSPEDDEPTSELLDGQYPDLSGEVLCEKYRVHRVVGIGGYGAVYEASDLNLGYRVAIKVLSPRAAAEDLAAFREEARRVTKLSCPNIVEWKSFEQDSDRTCFFVMEYLEGEDLEAVLKREQRLPVDRAVSILLQILNALCSAHQLPGGGSVLHLDLKPKNVFLLPAHGAGGERVKVIDFGIGQHFGGEEVEGDERPDAILSEEGSIRASRDHKTGTPRFPLSRACTPEYASPEQCAHLTVFTLDDPRLVQLDGRSDIYSLGVLAYRMLAGCLPYEKPERRTNWLRIHQEQPHRPLADHDLGLPQGLIDFVERCLLKDREQRWATAKDAYEALWTLSDGPTRRWLFG